LSSHGGFTVPCFFPTVVWAAPSFVFSHNMSHSDNGQTIAMAATSQVKLCPYCLIEVQFAAAGIKSQKLMYADALASLPKQVLRDILNTVDFCNKSDQPFDLLKEVLVGQF
jgi:hypothetical protein